MDDLIPCLAKSFFTGLQLLAVLSPLGGDGLPDGPLLVGLPACFKALGLQDGGLGLCMLCFKADSETDLERSISQSLTSRWREHRKKLQSSEGALCKAGDQAIHWSYHTQIVNIPTTSEALGLVSS